MRNPSQETTGNINSYLESLSDAPMQIMIKRTLAISLFAAIAVLAIACTSESEPTFPADSSVPTSETAFIETAEAITNEAVGITDDEQETPGDQSVDTSGADALLARISPPVLSPVTSDALGVPISDVELLDDETLKDAIASETITSETKETHASSEREDWENRLMDIWEDSIGGVVLINLETSLFGGNGTGAGWFWDDQGHIVTNHHVVRPTTGLLTPPNIIVETFEGDRFDAEFIGGDHISDIAVIKIDADPDTIKTLKIGDSANLRPGMTAIALGHPFGVEQAFSMTHGIISGLARSIQSQASSIPIPSVIQTDADMNPGNSGGPLLNSAGEVIGVNTQIRSISSINSGVGFATPINLVRRVVNNLIKHGIHEYPLIGISSWVLTPTWAERLDLDEEQRGLLVTAVSPSGPADKAGIRADTGVSQPKGDGDVIIRIDNVAIQNIYDLRSYIMLNTSPGDQIVIEILRDNQTIPITLTLGSWGDQFN